VLLGLERTAALDHAAQELDAAGNGEQAIVAAQLGQFLADLRAG
jgi:hypothetical protein